MNADERKLMRELYREACHGAGAEPRREARRKIEAMLTELGHPLHEVFNDLNLDMTAYFASKPIDP